MPSIVTALFDSKIEVHEQIIFALGIAILGSALMALVTRRGIWECRSAGLYLALVPFVNWSFAWAPTFPIGDTGGVLNPVTVVTGLVLVFRDFAQREVGKWIFALLAIGVLLTYGTAGGALAFASGAAFLVSELVDWLVYTFAKRPLSQRVLISSICSSPIDSAVFLYFAEQIQPGIFNVWSVLASIAGKILGALIVSEIIKRREKADPALAQAL
jgi:queuosine precursor transporter